MDDEDDKSETGYLRGIGDTIYSLPSAISRALRWPAELHMMNPDIPDEFPIGVAVFNDQGVLHHGSPVFQRFFDPLKTDEPFRRLTKAQDYLRRLLDPDAERGIFDEVEDRKDCGRVDFFLSWEEWGSGSGQPIKYRHLREGESADVRESEFGNERYFLYWFRKMNTPRPGDRETYIGCFIDITQSERSRRSLKKAELDFVKRLSRNLVAKEVQDKSLFALQTRPKAGVGRAGGDFFIFWPLRRQGEERPLMMAFVGDLDNHALRAASSIQQVATIINSFIRNARILLPPDENPARAVLDNLRNGLHAVKLLDVGGLDGILLVFDFSDRDRTVLHFAEGQLGAFVLSQGKDSKLTITQEVGMGFDADNRERNHPSVFRHSSALSDFNTGQITLDENDVIIAMTDGVRSILSESPDAGDQLELIADLVETARTSSHIGPENGMKTGEDEGTDPSARLLQGIVNELVPERAEPARDDRLAVAISVRRLKDVVANWDWNDRDD